MNLGVLHLGVCDQRYMLPLGQIERVLRMALFTPLDAQDVVGAINLAGTLFPVVSARRKLGFPESTPGVHQRLLLLKGNPAFVLWVDEVLDFLEVPLADFVPIRYQEHSSIEAIVRTSEGSTPVLRPEFFQPSALWESA